MKRRGFTLVELLIVIGLIAVLLSLLLPAVYRARQMAAQAGCAGNMRQIGMALAMYAQDNDGYFPKCASITSGPPRFQPGDWIDWWPGDNLQRSAIARYMGDHVQPRYFRCPSDVIENHTRNLSGNGVYVYSYTLNNYVASDSFNVVPPIRSFAITHPSERMLLVDEDESSADDGNYLPDYAPKPNQLAVRHDLNRGSRLAGQSLTQDFHRRGNVLMVDGHVDFVDRAWTLVVAHYDPRTP